MLLLEEQFKIHKNLKFTEKVKKTLSKRTTATLWFQN